MKAVILTGFMGTGKTSVGKMLARILSLPFRDVDRLIEEREGASITDIFEKQGESGFRRIETEVLNTVLGLGPAVVATGGGAVISSVNREIMHDAGIVVNLTAPAAEIEKRLASATDRPLLQQGRGDKIRRLLEEREDCYAEADVRIDTAGKKIEDVASEVAAYLEGKNVWKN